jgi:hypothetical protein
MTVDDFRQSLTAAKPPAEITLALVGLWWDAKGDWTRAHESAQQDEGPEGSWVHAYLHRKEGDQGNAVYWYGRAGSNPNMRHTETPVELSRCIGIDHLCANLSANI